MTRDYKKPMRSKKKPLPGWVWLFTGLAIGLFVSLLLWLKDRPATVGPSIAQQSREEIRTRTSRVEAVEEEKPRFDFYTLLPELEVVIPEGDYEVEPVKPRPNTTTQQPVVEEPGSYRLQAGSFKSLDEADRLKARLALLGVEADIQTVKVNKVTWHRVRLGPFGILDEVNAVRKRLDHHHINTLLMKNSG
jgi:cell division protein FtsN